MRNTIHVYNLFSKTRNMTEYYKILFVCIRIHSHNNIIQSEIKSVTIQAAIFRVVNEEYLHLNNTKLDAAQFRILLLITKVSPVEL